MATLGQELTKLNLIIGDNDDELFTEQEKINAINQALYDIVSDTGCNVAQVEVQIKDIRTTYEFPEDMIQLRLMSLFELRGNIIFNTTFQSMFNDGTNFNLPNDLAFEWHAPGTHSKGVLNHNIFFREFVSFNEFMIDPVFELESLNPPNPTEIKFGP